MRTHDWIDRRSLAMDRLVAARVRERPDLVNRARATLDRWTARTDQPLAVWQEWREILGTYSLDRLLALLESDAEEARRLRQSSPFCGILTQEERLGVLRDYETRRT